LKVGAGGVTITRQRVVENTELKEQINSREADKEESLRELQRPISCTASATALRAKQQGGGLGAYSDTRSHF
jgi:hypothetical protein